MGIGRREAPLPPVWEHYYRRANQNLVQRVGQQTNAFGVPD